MKWIKKVATTPLTNIARVIDSLDDSTNSRTNAPSIHAVREAVNSNWLSIYPIGSIYMSVNNIDPSTIFGGTWRQVKDKFLLACGDTFTNGETGGEINHTLTENEIPAHTHNVVGGTVPVSNRYVSYADVEVNFGSSGTGDPKTASYITAGATGVDIEGTAQSVGGGAAHNNMPPYLAVNVWYRTA